VLAVTSVDTFASSWLSARLGTFQLMHPGLAVKVDASTRLVDFTRENMDVGIRTGSGDWPGLTAHYLFRADYTPMLSPRLAESVGGIHQPDDLYKVAMLCADYRLWPCWFEAAGAQFDPARVIVGTRLDTEIYDAMAAMTDQGAAILTRNLYSDFVAKGQLVQPFDITASDGEGYWLVYLETRRNTPRIKAFRDWLLDQTADIRDQER
jgi:LysR family glycine cleavage system transcriptional activator